MKILYVCTTTDRGGAETALYRLAVAAKQKGHEVKIVSLKPLGVLAAQFEQAGMPRLWSRQGSIQTRRITTLN